MHQVPRYARLQPGCLPSRDHSSHSQYRRSCIARIRHEAQIQHMTLLGLRNYEATIKGGVYFDYDLLYTCQ